MADFAKTLCDNADSIFIAGEYTQSIPILLATTPVAYTKRGTALALNSSTNKYQPYNVAVTPNNCAVCVGVLGDDYDASGGDIDYAKMYVEGEFAYGSISAQSPALMPIGMYNAAQILVKGVK